MKKKDFLPYTLLFIQPIFMASNLVVARGGVEFVPPISLAFWRWSSVFLLLMLFNYSILYKKKILLKEYNQAEVNLVNSENGISPGQACVFYNKDQIGHKVLGGGWIKN